MKTPLVLMAVATVACMVSVEAGPTHKTWFDYLLPYYKDQFLTAQDSFESQVSEIDFQAAINLLIPYIRWGMAIPSCVTACTTTALSVLEPYGITSNSTCDPLCEGALIFVESIVV